ncbi:MULTISPECIES: hypothetical protein [Halomicrobium]|uniref:Uncharacterized protein n=2 Tax=Halomicrobium mukohataei TaxID=57705 RepID=C7NX36_HALMD|nr:MULTISPECIES: hypothetical protein [Halomicrobium]ACV46401.1 hypothetical protein Hmuk_0264 [Halomicrobium mukohataei DSM 12286]QCD64953.1 hypothetical protein E5139_04615 [Halomicrobium mukohataei]QFR19759.1 hypothetical protein GBQ70_04610 [Halomicrobium sp. ZPS1]
MSHWSRRSLLTAVGLAGVGSLAGCGALESTADAPQLSYTLSVDEIGETLLDRVGWSPGDGDAPWAAEQRRLYDAVVDGERYTTVGYDLVPDEQTYVEHEGTYYELHSTPTDLREVERSVLRLEWIGRRDELDDPPAAIEREDLPAIDARAVFPAYVVARAREHGGGYPHDIVEEGGYVYRFLDDSESELAPDPDHRHVSVHDTILEVSVTRRRLEEPVYTAMAIEIADTEAAFERALDGALVDVRVDEQFPDEQRRLFQRASAGEYEETTPLSEEYRGLLRALERHDLLDADPERQRPRFESGVYLKYDDRFYRFDVYVNPAD